MSEVTLNARHEAFIENIIKGMTAKDAVIAAGYSSHDITAKVTGHRLMRNPKIAKRIQRRIEAGLTFTDEELIGTLVEQARSNLTDLMDANGYIDIVEVKKRDLGHLINSMDIVESVNPNTGQKTVRVKVKAYSSQRALEILAKIKGLVNHTQKVEVSIQHQDEKRAMLTRAIQSQLNQGYDLKTAMINLSHLGIPLEELQLVDASQLDLNPVYQLDDTDYTDVSETDEPLDSDSEYTREQHESESESGDKEDLYDYDSLLDD